MANRILTAPRYIQSTDRMVGQSDPVYSDTLNLAAIDVLTGLQLVGAGAPLRFEYKSATTITVKAGGIGINTSGGKIYVIDTDADLTFADLDTGAEAGNTLYYVWVGTASSVISLKISASATTPTGLTYPVRFSGAFRNDGSSNIMPFIATADGMYWFDVDIAVAGADVTEVYDASLTTAFTDIPCSGFIPSGARLAYMTANGGTYTLAVRDNSQLSTNGIVIAEAAARHIFPVVVNASGIFEAKRGTAETTRISVVGYQMF